MLGAMIGNCGQQDNLLREFGFQKTVWLWNDCTRILGSNSAIKHPRVVTIKPTLCHRPHVAKTPRPPFIKLSKKNRNSSMKPLLVLSTAIVHGTEVSKDTIEFKMS